MDEFEQMDFSGWVSSGCHAQCVPVDVVDHSSVPVMFQSKIIEKVRLGSGHSYASAKMASDGGSSND